MPWNECKPMDERLRFVARLLEGEKMAPLCREFGISRVTGYKIFDRYKECGLDGLHDRSKAPYRQANKLPFQVERANSIGRSERIRTSDPLHPMQVRYQTAPRSDRARIIAESLSAAGF